MFIIFLYLSKNFFFKTQRLAIELSRNHAPTSSAPGSVSDMGHVSLLEQSLDNIEDDNDRLVTKQQNDAQLVVRRAQVSRPRATAHTALDVETASGMCCVLLVLSHIFTIGFFAKKFSLAAQIEKEAESCLLKSLCPKTKF